MIIELIALAVTGAIAYFWHEKVLKDRLDTPRNNEVVKGLDKSERKEKIKETDVEIKGLKEEIKEKDKERKECLKDENRKEEAQEKLEEIEEKQKELKESEANLSDLKEVEKNSY
jgi:DNA-binding transcriptional MerR regulator